MSIKSQQLQNLIQQYKLGIPNQNIPMSSDEEQSNPLPNMSVETPPANPTQSNIIPTESVIQQQMPDLKLTSDILPPQQSPDIPKTLSPYQQLLQEYQNTKESTQKELEGAKNRRLGTDIAGALSQMGREFAMAPSGRMPSDVSARISAMGERGVEETKEQIKTRMGDLKSQLDVLKSEQKDAQDKLKDARLNKESDAKINYFKDRIDALSEDRDIKQQHMDNEKQGLKLKEIAIKSKELEKDGKITPGEKAVDTAFGKAYVDWNNKGKPRSEDGIKSMNEAIDNLKSTPDLSGGLTGRLPDWATREDVKNQRQLVETQILGSLKDIFGGRISNMEMSKLLKTSYNEAADPEVNIASLQRAIAKVKNIANSMNSQSEYFEDNGTLKGIKSTISTPKPKSSSLTPQQIQRMNELLKKQGG